MDRVLAILRGNKVVRSYGAEPISAAAIGLVLCQLGASGQVPAAHHCTARQPGAACDVGGAKRKRKMYPTAHQAVMLASELQATKTAGCCCCCILAAMRSAMTCRVASAAAQLTRLRHVDSKRRARLLSMAAPLPSDQFGTAETLSRAHASQTAGTTCSVDAGYEVHPKPILPLLQMPKT